jgi:hypothetical protein
LLTCSLKDTKNNDYRWELLSAQGGLIYTNGTLIDGAYSYAVFDNATFSFLYIFSAEKSTFACIRNSDNMVLDMFTVVQCPAGTRLNNIFLLFIDYLALFL